MRVQLSVSKWLYIVAVLMTAIMVYPIAAQDTTPITPVSADDINAVAKEMYCPVCENIPLDVCPTDACQQWREEIGAQLSAGKTPAEIKSSFVARYGDRVIGTPEDPALRALSLLATPAIAVVAVLVAGWVIFRWRRNQRPAQPLAAPASNMPIADDDYRARLEQDLLSRR